MWNNKPQPFFPIIVFYTESRCLDYVEFPAGIVMGKAFQVLAVNATPDMYDAAKRCYNLGLNLNDCGFAHEIPLVQFETKTTEEKSDDKA